MDDAADYCRQIEAYLCRKNGGHLVRIVGPAFEKVRDWSAQGVPLKVAFRGIDRCCERANAKSGRRRPMRIEFCEADVLAAFDDWRRAIGVSASQVAETESGDALVEVPPGDNGITAAHKNSLTKHIQRTVARLLAPKGLTPDARYDAEVREIIEELDTLAVQARGSRGDTRAGIIERLAQLDARLLELARGRIDDRTASALQSEADAELAAFASRMPPESLARARQRAFQRFLRDALNLPVLSYE